MQMKSQICFDSNLAYLDHSLPPLGLFLQINLNFLSLSQTHMLKHKESYFMRNWLRIQKLPLFPIINHSPHKRPTFDNKRQTRVFWQTKTLTLLFQNSQVVADPFLALALFSPPLASSTKTGSLLSKVGLLWGEWLASCGENGWLWEKGGVFEIFDQFLLEQLSLCLNKCVWLRDRKLRLICKNKTKWWQRMIQICQIWIKTNLCSHLH